MQYINKALQEEIDGVRYAASLRASIVRRGSWYKFDYWDGLGFGACCNVVNRIDTQVIELKGIIKNNTNDKDLEYVHGFLQQFLFKVGEAIDEFSIEVQQLCETIFSKSLKNDYRYWQTCEDRWGLGFGCYKTDIRDRTDEWFSNEERRSSHEFLEEEIQNRWKHLLRNLNQYFESSQVTTV